VNTNRIPIPRPALKAIPPPIHGARDHSELACLDLHPDEVIDFSTNANPYGPPPLVLQAVQAAITAETLGPYPDRDCLALKRAIAAADGVPTDHILPGNGTAELIQTIALAFVHPGTTHLLVAPTFGEYARAIQLMEGLVHEYRPIPRIPPLSGAQGAQATHELCFCMDDVATTIQSLKPASVWLCNPNNPTGQHWSAAQLAELHTAAPDALWVIDEAYQHFLAQPEPISTPAPNQIILRSMTKAYALAGLRLGYAVAPPAIIEVLQSVQPPWSVNSLAQIAGVAALQPPTQTWRDQTLAELRQHAHHLWHDLKGLGLTVLPTDTTFTLVEVNDAADFRRRLLKRHLLVRDASSFGLSRHVRIAARRPEENRLLVEAIRQLQERD
jgi:histidinol-phosphate aminotransferase